MTYVGAYELNIDHGNKVRVIYIYRRLSMCTGTDLSIEISFNHLEVRRYIHIQIFRLIKLVMVVIRPDVFPVFHISCDHPKQGHLLLYFSPHLYSAMKSRIY